jgi:streptomycin 6-kinase
MSEDLARLAPWITKWELEPDGAPFATGSSLLLAVRRGGEAAFLKFALEAEEKRGGAVMAYYDGRLGAAQVIAHDADAVLLERLEGPRSLTAMARGGEDDEACRILCETAAKLHAPRAGPRPEVLIPLETWFAALWPAAAGLGGVYAASAEVAREILAAQESPVVLHGDIHHGNVLDDGKGGWRAIDPKGLWGDRGYDYANLICNPDAETALTHFEQRVTRVSEAAGLPRTRVLSWVLAYLGLSASWTLSTGGDPRQALAIGEAAQAALGRR